MLNQILTQDQLDVWNQIAERDLASSQKYGSGIPKLKSCISYEIEQFKLSKNKENEFLNQTKRISYDQLRPASPPIEQPTTQTVQILAVSCKLSTCTRKLKVWQITRAKLKLCGRKTVN